MNLLNHKGYYGSVVCSVEDGVIHGKILFINDLITYEAESFPDIKNEFIAAVDDYLETCTQIGKSPDKSLSGQFNVRIKQELHKKAAAKAASEDMSLNAVVEMALEAYLATDLTVTHNHHHRVVLEMAGETVTYFEADAGGSFQVSSGSIHRVCH